MQLPLALPVLVGQLVGRAGEARARVVDEHVDAAHLLGRAGHDAAGDVRVGDVGGQPLGAKLLGRLAQRLLPARDHQHPRALLRKLGAQRPADAAARARHDAHPIAQSEVHGADHAWRGGRTDVQCDAARSRPAGQRPDGPWIVAGIDAERGVLSPSAAAVLEVVEEDRRGRHAHDQALFETV